MNNVILKQLGFLYFKCATCENAAKYCDGCRLSEVMDDLVRNLKREDALPEMDLL